MTLLKAIRDARFAALLLLVPVASGVNAQTTDYPNKPVTIVTPFAAGSGPDAVLRIISEKLSRQWNQRVLVDNRPGGAGFIAIETAKKASNDG